MYQRLLFAGCEVCEDCDTFDGETLGVPFHYHRGQQGEPDELHRQLTGEPLSPMYIHPIHSRLAQYNKWSMSQFQ